jgi:hypothetical protein
MTKLDVTRIAVEHVRIVADRPFEKVTETFERETGQFDWAAYQQLNAGADPDDVRAKIKAMEGASGFMLFRTSDHGALLRLAGQKKKALQYLVGKSALCRPDDAARRSCQSLRPATRAHL